MSESLNLFQIEKTCEYRGETYRVRDNGALYRCRRLNSKKRPLDEKWTFGSPNKKTGYMTISSEVVHRIVATAFHGPQPSKKHVVDHIDTNRKNNRPENLRWLTRLENLLLNPITLNRILYKYGSIDNFLRAPSEPYYGDLTTNFDWMRTVTKEEAENARNNLLKWGRAGKIPRGGQLGDWIFSQQNTSRQNPHNHNTLLQSLTPNALQKNWKTPCEFPNCPEKATASSILLYSNHLTKGQTFSINQYQASTVEEAGINQENNTLVVITKMSNIKPFGVAKVYIEGSHFVHEQLGSFFQLDGAQKEFTLALGLKWDGEETLDDLTN